MLPLQSAMTCRATMARTHPSLNVARAIRRVAKCEQAAASACTAAPRKSASPFQMCSASVQPITNTANGSAIRKISRARHGRAAHQSTRRGALRGFKRRRLDAAGKERGHKQRSGKGEEHFGECDGSFEKHRQALYSHVHCAARRCSSECSSKRAIPGFFGGVSGDP